MSKDEYYNTPEARLNTILGDQQQFFLLIRGIKKEYDREPKPVPYTDYPTWLEQRYGIQLVLNSDGRITSEHHIVDEKKYLICRLKYPG